MNIPREVLNRVTPSGLLSDDEDDAETSGDEVGLDVDGKLLCLVPHCVISVVSMPSIIRKAKRSIKTYTD